jgi:hypothetical protein
MSPTRRDHALELSLVVLMPLAGAGVLGVSCRLLGPRFVSGVVAVVLVVLAMLIMAGLRWRFANLAQHDSEAMKQARRTQRLRQLVLSLGAVGLLTGVAWYTAPSPLTSLSPEARHAVYAQDAELLDQYRRGMEMVITRLERLDMPPADGPLGADGEAALLDSWRSFLGYALAVEGLRKFHEDYYRFDLDRHRDDHVTGFLLTFAADAALYEKTARMTTWVLRNPDAERFLDNPHPGLPAQTLSHLPQHLLGAQDRLRVAAGRSYLRVLDDVEVDDAKLRPVAGRLRDWLDQHLLAIRGLGELPTVEITYRAELQALERTLARGWYPLQKKAAEVLGDTRVRRVGRYLIDRPLRERVDQLLEPGDILLARKNWYLSNVGLPGFWPHAMIYLGAPDKLADYFDQPEVAVWLAKEGIEGGSLADALERRHPDAWAHYLSVEDGEPHRVIEAVSEGVVVSTLGHCAGDYLAALRPELDRVSKARAIWRAFEHYGRPYDFDFDFATDHAVVCTELVWRAYRPQNGAPGIELPLEQIAGRTTLPAHSIAAFYARSPECPLDFVAFVDAREKQGKAFLSTEAAFRGTVDRTQFDIFQE